MYIQGDLFYELLNPSMSGLFLLKKYHSGGRQARILCKKIFLNFADKYLFKKYSPVFRQSDYFIGKMEPGEKGRSLVWYSC